VDGPVEGELEGPPVEAPVSRQSLRRAGGIEVVAYRTCTRELMATFFRPLASIRVGYRVQCVGAVVVVEQ
jgi:hypothetical protein